MAHGLMVSYETCSSSDTVFAAIIIMLVACALVCALVCALARVLLQHSDLVNDLRTIVKDLRAKNSQLVALNNQLIDLVPSESAQEKVRSSSKELNKYLCLETDIEDVIFHLKIFMTLNHDDMTVADKEEVRGLLECKGWKTYSLLELGAFHNYVQDVCTKWDPNRSSIVEGTFRKTYSLIEVRELIQSAQDEHTKCVPSGPEFW